jgi:hypothetical protein
MAVLILAVFVGGLLHKQYNDYQIQLQRLQLDEYTIINDPEGMTYLLNSKTGETWRWYRNVEEGEIESEGWTPVNFNVGGLDFSIPAECRELQMVMLEADREQKFDKARQKNTQPVE